MRNLLLRGLSIFSATALGLAAVSCGGGGSSGGGGNLVLVGFNLPNVAGVALNQPLVFTFSDTVDPTSVTPDTVQIVGSPSFTFETIVVDGNLVAELPSVPSFEDYSDSGLAVGVTYSVFLPTFPAVDTVRSLTANPLVQAEAFSFTTNPIKTFIEPRRPIVHAPGPISGPDGRGDNDGCLQNADNSLYVYPGFQFGTSPAAVLLCLKNEGAPHIILDESTPTHDQRAVGSPSAVSPGLVDLPAVRVHFNEPVDPITVVTPYNSFTQLSLNVQLWFVGDSDANPVSPVQVKTNRPIVVQNVQQAEAILVAVGPQSQGTYLINVQGIKDLPGNFLALSDSPSPAAGGYETINAGLVGKVPPGYRMYFRTLQIPTTSGSITESFSNNFAEETSGVFTQSTPALFPATAIAGSPAVGSPGFTLTYGDALSAGQATSANWNGAYRYLGLSGAPVNRGLDDGTGRLKAVFAPYLGNGDDGTLTVTTSSTLTSSSTSPGDANGDGIYEFENLTISTGGVLRLEGDRPVVILVRGVFTCNGTILASGTEGTPGLDTDGSTRYANVLSARAAGTGGVGGPGGGRGGNGAPSIVNGVGDAQSGSAGVNVYGEAVGSAGAGNLGTSGDGSNQGGGGGGYGTTGSPGAGAANQGIAWGTPEFTRTLASFVPDRCYQPGANLAGGSGAGGGGLDDDNGASETGNGSVSFAATGQILDGDDGGGGGGGAGGALWVSARVVNVGATAVLRFDGGRGGNTYGPAQQILFDPDAMTPNDEYVTGATDPNAPGTGQGAGGGGGSGGAILFQGRDALTVVNGATMSAVGGAGGTAATKNGGAGGAGRIALMSFQASGDLPAGAFSIPGAGLTPAPGAAGAVWAPTVDVGSAGVSNWIDMVTNSAVFSTSEPFWADNFGLLTGQGLTMGVGEDFDAILEFQGAASLSPNQADPTVATGLTAWSTDRSLIDGKVFVRWRWRFFVNHPDANGGNNPDFDPAVNAMPAILDFTLPFTK